MKYIYIQFVKTKKWIATLLWMCSDLFNFSLNNKVYFVFTFSVHELLVLSVVFFNSLLFLL